MCLSVSQELPDLGERHAKDRSRITQTQTTLPDEPPGGWALDALSGCTHIGSLSEAIAGRRSRAAVAAQVTTQRPRPVGQRSDQRCRPGGLLATEDREAGRRPAPPSDPLACVPVEWEQFGYSTFLDRRRPLIAQVVRTGFGTIAGRACTFVGTVSCRPPARRGIAVCS